MLVDPVRPTEARDNSTSLPTFDPSAPVKTAAVELPVIRNPAWQDRPTGQEMARHYPESAIRRGVQGQATISCTVTVPQTVDGRAIEGAPVTIPIRFSLK